jgi:6-phosphogluconolactonase (cycloisomerase 2 family)
MAANYLINVFIIFSPSVTFEPGAGPRHIDFHPTEPVAFVAHELNSTISCMRPICYDCHLINV